LFEAKKFILQPIIKSSHHFVSDFDYYLVILNVLLIRQTSYKAFFPYLLFVGSFIFKLIYLDARSLANDEPFSVYHAQMSVCEIIKEITKGNNPPLFELLLHYWINIFGISEYSVRFLPALCSALAGILVFGIGKKNHSFSLGITAFLLFTFSDAVTLYAHTARAYSLLLFLCCLGFYLVLELLKSPSILRLLSLGAVNALMIYTHYMSPFILFAQGLTVLLSVKPKEKAFLFFLYSVGLTIVFSLPLMSVFLRQVITSSVQGTWVKAPSGWLSIHYMLWRFFNAPLSSIMILLLLLATVIYGSVNMKKLHFTSFTKAIVCWSSMLLFIFLLSFTVPLFIRRYVLFTVPAICLLLPACIAYLFKKKPKLKFISLGVIVLVVAVSTHPNKDNDRHLREMVSYVKGLKKELTKDDIVVFSPSFDDMGICYYYARDVFEHYSIEGGIKKNMYAYFEQEKIYPVSNINQLPLSALDKCHELIFMNGNTGTSHILAYLKKHFNIVSQKHFHEVHEVYVFVKKEGFKVVRD